MYNLASTINLAEVTLVVEPDELHDNSTQSLLMAGVGIGLALVSTMFLFGFTTTGAMDLIESLPIKAVVAYSLLVIAGISTLVIKAGLKDELTQVIAFGGLGSFVCGAVYHAMLLQ